MAPIKTCLFGKLNLADPDSRFNAMVCSGIDARLAWRDIINNTGLPLGRPVSKAWAETLAVLQQAYVCKCLCHLPIRAANKAR
jgi:hypothetical protein